MSNTSAEFTDATRSQVPDLRAIPVVLLLLWLTTVSLWGAPTATIAGRVWDSSGSAIPGASVKVTDEQRSVQRTVRSNSEGAYSVPGLIAGQYRIEVVKDSFEVSAREGLIVNAGSTVTIDFALQPGSVRSSVTVSAENTLVNRESMSVSTVVDRRFAQNLPLNGRSFQGLLELTPGLVMTPVTTNSPGQFVVNGQRSNANYFTIDGVSANIGASTTVTTYQEMAGTLPGYTALGGTNNMVSVDALEEFRIETSTMAPEYGRMPGGNIGITSRSGTNELHGSLYEYFRNEKLDANDWFANRMGQPRPPLRQNNFGGTLGGPIMLPRIYNGRDKTFFFVSYEAQRNRLPNFLEALTPNQEIRQTAIEVMRPVLRMYPLPNAPSRPTDPAGTGRYVVSYGNPYTMNSTSVKIDHHFTQSLRVFGRVGIAPTESSQRVFVNQFNAGSKDTRSFTFGLDANLSTNMFLENRLNYSDQWSAFNMRQAVIDGAEPAPLDLLLPPGSTLEDTGVSAFFSVGGAGTSPNLTLGRIARNGQRQFHWVSNYTATVGTHTFKAGIDYRRLIPVQSTRNNSYGYSFGLVSDAATTGRASSLSVQGFAPPGHFGFVNFSAYVQDAWKATRRLTLTYGARWEVNPAPGERDGRLPYTVTGLENPMTATLAPFGTPLWETTWANVAPRIGAAYKLSDRHDIVLRGGWGLYYDLGTGQATRGYSNWPYSTYRSVPNVYFPASGADLVPGTTNMEPPISATFYAFPDHKLPKSYQWNVTVEKTFGDSDLLSLAYVGSAGRKLSRMESLRNTTATNPPQVQVNPEWFAPSSSVVTERNQSSSDYNALQAQWRRRFHRNFQFQAAYTWSKSLDNMSDEGVIGIPMTRPEASLDWARSSYDIRHMLSFATSYEFPRWNTNPLLSAVVNGWAFDTIGRLRTAMPVNVYVSTDLLNLGLSSSASVVRPDLVAGVPVVIYDSQFPGGQRLNRDAFRTFTESRQGTLGRNAINGFDSTALFDVSVRRAFALAEAARLEFRAEFFNITNTPTFSKPVTNISSTSFGLSESMLASSLGSTGGGGVSEGFAPMYQAGGPRRLQFSLRLSFRM